MARLAMTSEEQLDGNAVVNTAGHTRTLAAYAQGVAFLLGLALLVLLVRVVGAQPIFDALGRVGIGFLLILAASGARHLLRTVAMRLAVPPEHRNLNLRQAFAARLGGEAVTFATFTGPLLGEAAKVALLKKRVPLAHGITALLIDNIIYNLSVGLFILSGVAVMLAVYPVPAVVRYLLIFIAAGMGLGVLATIFAASQRVMVISWLLGKLSRFSFVPHSITAKREKAQAVEDTIYDFATHRRAAFVGMWVLNIAAHATSVLEVYLGLKLLGLSQAQVQQAYIIESLTKVINFAFGFVPGTIGVYEGGTAFILRTLGFQPALGVALGVVRKSAIVFWVAIGVGFLAKRTAHSALEQLVERHPRLRKFMDNLVVSNMMHRPARTAVSILGIGLGVLLIVFTVGLAHGVLRERGKRESNVNAEIIINPPGAMGMAGNARFSLPVGRAQEIAKLPGVRMAIPVGQRLVQSDRGGALSGGRRMVDGINYDDYAALTGMRLVEGRKLALTGDEAVVDTQWIKDNRQENAGLGTQITIFERKFTIVGIYDPANGGRVKIPLATLQKEYGSEGFVNAIFVSCANPAEQDAVAARIHAQFPDDRLLFTRDIPDLYAQGVPALNVFVKVVVGVATAISLLIILLAMYTTVTERTRQIGILKALGMSNGKIAWVIEQEALLVSFLGVLTGFILTLLARLAVMRSSSLVVDIEPKWLAISLCVGLLGGTVGALYPALRAARQDAVEALSYE
jgi:putative ABC transport system permease protein